VTDTPTEPIDRAFPGAHSQVPGAHSDSARAPLAPPPLDATQTRTEQGWTVRLPVRAEQVRVSKEVVIRERVVVRRRAVEDLARVEGKISREVLHLQTDGAVEVEHRPMGQA
jgi:stress response protein YsnF